MLESETRKSIVFTNLTNVPIEDLQKAGAEKTKVQYLIDEKQGSNRFSTRIYTLEKGGHTPLDEHLHEHHVYVLSGRGLLRESIDETHPLKTIRAGDTIFIPSNAIHQFINRQREPLVFLCVRGNPSLYSSREANEEKQHPESERNYC